MIKKKSLNDIHIFKPTSIQLMIDLKRIFVFISLLAMCLQSKAQGFNLTESQVIEKYNVQTDNINEIKALYLYCKKKNYKQGKLHGLLELQKYYLSNGNTTLSLKFSNLAETIALKLQNNEALSSIYLYRGQASAILGLYKEAKNNLNKSVLYGNKINGETEKHLQLATIYANFAGMYEGEENANDSIAHYLRKSLHTIQSTPTDRLTERQKTDYYDLLMTGYMNMGMLYTYILQPAELDKAEPYFEKVVEFSKTAPKYFEPSNLATYKALGVFYNRKKNYVKSIDFFEKALRIEKDKHDPRMRLLIYKELKDSYDSMNNISKHNQYLDLYSSLNDSINRTDKKSIVEESRDQIKRSIETVKKNHNKAFNKIIIVSATIALLVIIAIWTVFYRKNRKIKNNFSLLIEKLKDENQSSVNDQIEVVEDHADETESHHTGHNSKVTISNDTEKKILKKLKIFEESNRFLKKDINLTSLSHQINTNPKYLSEVIRIHKNQNFNTYINSLRINYIVQKLYNEPKYREYKISYLAEECGYTSPQVFVIAFKKQTGVTPSYYIERLKNDNPDLNPILT